MKISKIIKLISKPKILHVKILRRFSFIKKSLFIRLNSYLGFNINKIPRNLSFREPNDLCTKPGNPIFFKKYYNKNGIYQKENDCKNILDHRFKIFSDFYFDTNIKSPHNLKELADLCDELPADLVEKYKPINWHCDFKSGYVWDRNLLYIDILIAPVSSAEIKIPRELSRFQHIGEMAFEHKKDISTEFFLQLADWITSNPVGRGVNWACTMDVSIRAINWIWGLRFFEKELESYPKLKRTIFHSLIDHGKHIYNNLEYYEECTGNHYLSNIVGLIYIASRIPEHDDADLWLLFGTQELVSEMEREVYDDGFSHEASTYYHRLVTEMFLSASSLVERISKKRKERLLKVNIKSHKIRPKLININKNKINLYSSGLLLPSDFYKKLKLMVELISSISKPNGMVPQIGDNDSARLHKLVPQLNMDMRDHTHILALAGFIFNDESFLHIYSKSNLEAEIIAGDYRNTRKINSNEAFKKRLFFKDAGIGILKNTSAFLLVSCGTNGQKGRGGHGHNDKNSFELNINGLDFFVDGGCPFYTSHPDLRNMFRSTNAHSTLVIDGKEQDLWESGLNGLFILEETCEPFMELNDDSILSSHVGYGDKHEREFKLKSNSILINDYCKAPYSKNLLFNLDPLVEVGNLYFKDDSFFVDLFHKNGKKILLNIKNVKTLEVVEGFFGIGFGLRVKNKMLKVEMIADSAETIISW